MSLAAPEDTSTRGKEFLFNALWAAVGETEFKSVPVYRHKPVRCSVQIPLTFMFREGEPAKALSMDRSKQFITRVSPEEPSLYENARSDAQNRGVKQYRNMLVEYQRENKYDDCQSSQDEPYLCTVTYVDGEQEDLTAQRLDLLMHNDNWRMQILLLQGYVPVVSRLSGNYEMATNVSNTQPSDCCTRLLLHPAAVMLSC